jgi:hypothetical protein
MGGPGVIVGQDAAWHNRSHFIFGAALMIAGNAGCASAQEQDAHFESAELSIDPANEQCRAISNGDCLAVRARARLARGE